MSQTLYDKYGGLPGVQTVVHKFYERINEERSLDKYFAAVNMERLMDHQVNLFSKILGGPDNYEGRSLKPSHAHLNIDVKDFALVGRLLQETLDDCGLDPADVEVVMGIIVSVKNDIVTEKAV